MTLENIGDANDPGAEKESLRQKIAIPVVHQMKLIFKRKNTEKWSDQGLFSEFVLITKFH